MATYNFHEIEKGAGDFNTWLIIKTILLGTNGFDELKNLNPTHIEITLTVNGIEVEFLKFAHLFIDQVDDLAKQHANRKIESLVGAKLDAIYEALNEAQEKINEAIDLALSEEE